MISGQTSKLNHGINLIATTGPLTSNSGPGDDIAASHTPSLPLPASDAASSIHLHPVNLPGSSIPDDSAVHGITFDVSHHSPIDENDIVIA